MKLAIAAFDPEAPATAGAVSFGLGRAPLRPR
jgi:hypothetical protein